MRAPALFAALALAAGLALADDLTYRQGSFAVHLHSSPCALEPLAVKLAGEGAQTMPKAATVKTGKLTLLACWAIDVDRDVLIADEAGDGGYMPLGWFKVDLGV